MQKHDKMQHSHDPTSEKGHLGDGNAGSTNPTNPDDAQLSTTGRGQPDLGGGGTQEDFQRGDTQAGGRSGWRDDGDAPTTSAPARKP